MSKSDKVRSRNNKSKGSGSLNPFEQQVQKSKFSVLGRREKSNKGTPGASKKKAQDLRKNTIGVDLRNVNKKNKFRDNRISAKDADFDLNALARYASLRKKVQNKQANRKTAVSKFHLNDDSDEDSDDNGGDSSDDEILKSKGQALTDIRHHILQGQIEEAAEGEEVSTQRQMNELNFGGGGNKRGGPDDLFTKRTMTREEAINDMIKQSKILKVQRQEETANLLEDIAEVDSQWAEIEKSLNILDKDTTLTKWQKAEVGKDKEHDDWCSLVDNLKGSKSAKADKSVSRKTEQQLANEKKKLAAKLEMEKLYEQPDDERAGEQENQRLAKYQSVDQIVEVKENRNTAQPISFDREGNLNATYKKDLTALDNPESEASDLESSDDEEEGQNISKPEDEVYDFATELQPPKKIATFLKNPEKVTSAKCQTWLRALKAISDGTRKAKLNNFTSNILKFSMVRCDELENLQPLQDKYQLICELMATDKNTKRRVVTFLLESWDSISDRACPGIDPDQTEVEACYGNIEEFYQVDQDKQALNQLTFYDYAVMVLTKNALPMNRFRSPFTSMIWRTLESVLLDCPTFAYKLETVKLFLPECRHRFWTAAIKVVATPAEEENSQSSATRNSILSDMVDSWQSLPCFRLLFQDISKSYEILKISDANQEKLDQAIKSKKKLQKTKLAKSDLSTTTTTNPHKTQMMFEPKFERVLDPAYEKAHSDNPIERTKQLKRKLKVEQKNALKGLRQDAEYINTAKLNKQIKLDAQRKRKVKELMGDLGNQEGEVRKMNKKKYKLFQ